MTTERPASIIVANWREKTCSDFALTFLARPKSPRVGAPRRRAQLLDPLREQAVAAQRVARGGDVRRLDLARVLAPWALMAL